MAAEASSATDPRLESHPYRAIAFGCLRCAPVSVGRRGDLSTAAPPVLHSVSRINPPPPTAAAALSQRISAHSYFAAPPVGLRITMRQLANYRIVVAPSRRPAKESNRETKTCPSVRLCFGGDDLVMTTRKTCRSFWMVGANFPTALLPPHLPLPPSATPGRKLTTSYATTRNLEGGSGRLCSMRSPKGATCRRQEHQHGPRPPRALDRDLGRVISRRHRGPGGFNFEC